MIDLVCLVTLHFTFFYWKPKFLFSTHLSRITCLRIQWAGQRKGLKSWRFGDIPGPLLGLRALLHAAQGRSAFRGREALRQQKNTLSPHCRALGLRPAVSAVGLSVTRPACRVCPWWVRPVTVRMKCSLSVVLGAWGWVCACGVRFQVYVGGSPW